jgi:toxin YoeB
MNIDIKPDFYKDIEKLKKENPKYLGKVFELMSNIQDTLFTGLGEPEPLKGNYQGYWSRRITKEHRLIYKVENNLIIYVSCHGHYGDS